MKELLFILQRVYIDRELLYNTVGSLVYEPGITNENSKLVHINVT